MGARLAVPLLDEQDVSGQTCRKLFAAAFQAVKSEETCNKTKKKQKQTSQIKMRNSCGEDFAD